MVKQLRKSKGWSQETLALECGLTQSFIHQLESGKTGGTIETLEKIAAALKVPVSELFKKAEDDKSNPLLDDPETAWYIEALKEGEVEDLTEKDIENIRNAYRTMKGIVDKSRGK